MAALAKQSPADARGEIKVPVMLVHGKADDNVPHEPVHVRWKARSKTAGTAAGDHASAPGEGHGFYKPREPSPSSTAAWKPSCDKYIGPGAKVATSP